MTNNVVPALLNYRVFCNFNINMIYITKYSFYKPSQENLREMPKLEYVDPLFRRRLSQITRMTIGAVHGVIDGNEDAKLVFTSFRGEIARELKVNKGLVEDADVMPASFSISVFNTPAAATTIAFKMKAGYTAIYPSEDDFRSGFLAAVAPILAGEEKKIIFVYADEKIPEELENCEGVSSDNPMAVACVISNANDENAISLDLDSAALESPENFLEFLESKK